MKHPFQDSNSSMLFFFYHCIGYKDRKGVGIDAHENDSRYKYTRILLDGTRGLRPVNTKLKLEKHYRALSRADHAQMAIIEWVDSPKSNATAMAAKGLEEIAIKLKEIETQKYHALPIIPATACIDLNDHHHQQIIRNPFSTTTSPTPSTQDPSSSSPSPSLSSSSETSTTPLSSSSIVKYQLKEKTLPLRARRLLDREETKYRKLFNNYTRIIQDSLNARSAEEKYTAQLAARIEPHKEAVLEAVNRELAALSVEQQQQKQPEGGSGSSINSNVRRNIIVPGGVRLTKEHFKALSTRGISVKGGSVTILEHDGPVASIKKTAPGAVHNTYVLKEKLERSKEAARLDVTGWTPPPPPAATAFSVDMDKEAIVIKEEKEKGEGKEDQKTESTTTPPPQKESFLGKLFGGFGNK